jgi:hypothetical protein
MDRPDRRSCSSGSPEVEFLGAYEGIPAHAGADRQQEMCLIHHYTTSTCQTLSRHEGDLEIWRDAVFWEGSRYPFVLDAVLAVAACHKAFLRPLESRENISICLYYQCKSLQVYREHLAKLDRQNCHAAFAVSVVINVLTIALSRGCGDLPPTPPLETLSCTFELLRGIGIVLRSSTGTLISGRYKALFSTTSSHVRQKLPDDILQAMERLRIMVQNFANDKDPSQIEVYHSTIDALEQHFELFGQNKNFAAVVSWPVMVGEFPMGLLQNSDPCMMLIFVHYGVLYLQIHDRWWARDFSSRLIEQISEPLHRNGEAWVSATAWARSQIHHY